MLWFDEWVLKPGDYLSSGERARVRASQVEERLVHSEFGFRISDFGFAQPGMSANAFGSDWAQLESQTFRFRDPLNKERRFLPLRLDDAPIKGSLAQFLYINWLPSVLKRGVKVRVNAFGNS